MTPDNDQPFTLAQMAGSPRRRRTGLVVGIAAGALALIAATIGGTVLAMRSGTETPAAASQASAPSSAAAPATTAATAATAPTTAAPAPTAAKTFKLGEKATNSTRGSTSTAYVYKQPVARTATPPDQEGFEWAAADVEVCPSTTNIVTRGSWRIAYADNTTIDPSSVGYQQFPEPAYPWDDREVVGGRCVRGWIVFPAPVGKKPAFVEYAPQGFIADWAVS